MSEPLSITIPKAELINWLEHIENGLNPYVKYKDSKVEMLEDSYKVRGDMLYYLNHRIKSFIPEVV